jgi:hypothetical protein
MAIATVGLLMAVAGTANADTGAGGVPILHATTSPMVHACNVIASDSTWQAVLCSDLITTEVGSNYFVQGQAEAYCQKTAAPHAMGTCKQIVVDDHLYVGSGGSTADAKAECDTNCPANGRLEVRSTRWGYTVAGAANGTCSSNVDSAYQVWAIITAGETSWILPDKVRLTLGSGEGANDGANQSSNHYFVCP